MSREHTHINPWAVSETHMREDHPDQDWEKATDLGAALTMHGRAHGHNIAVSTGYAAEVARRYRSAREQEMEKALTRILGVCTSLAESRDFVFKTPDVVIRAIEDVERYAREGLGG